tara:strand:- start:485 stop:1258 length:774 start_codon:yes stop_codon:yes gene_type:complete
MKELEESKLNDALDRQLQNLKHGRSKSVKSQVIFENDYRLILEADIKKRIPKGLKKAETLKKAFDEINDDDRREEFKDKLQNTIDGITDSENRAYALAKTNAEKKLLNSVIEYKQKIEESDIFEQVIRGNRQYVPQLLKIKNREYRAEGDKDNYEIRELFKSIEKVKQVAEHNHVFEAVRMIKELNSDKSYAIELRLAINEGMKNYFEGLLEIISKGYLAFAPEAIPMAKKYHELNKLETAVFIGMSMNGPEKDNLF